jgi:hypothetical protein
VPSTTTSAFSTRDCRQTSMSASSNETANGHLGSKAAICF